MPRRAVLIVALVCVAAVGLGAALAFARSNRTTHPRLIGWAVDRAVPAFPLVTSNGRPTSLAAFGGKVLVLAPSLTLCHEVCPMTTFALERMQRAVAAAGLGERVAFAEATVDPWRDSPARLRAYARMSGAGRLHLLTGSPAQIARLWKFFGVGYRRVPQGRSPDVDWWTSKPEAFDVEHTDGLFFVDAQGRERIFIVGMPNVGGRLSPALERLLSKTGVYNLRHPIGAWTVEQALADLSRLLGRPISST